MVADASGPGVSMLWERTDAKEALRERFGFADAEDAAFQLTANLAEHWGFRVETVERVVISDQNLLAWVVTPVGRFVVKGCVVQSMFARLGAIAEIVSRLGDQGLPVAAPALSLDGRARAIVGNMSVMVLPEIAGDFVDPADRDGVRAAGETLARVHLALADVEADLAEAPGWAPPLASEPRPLRQEAPARERAPGAAARLDVLVAELPELDVAPSLIHGDVRGANILCDAGEVSALLDWDGMMLGHRVRDLAAGAVKLATRFQTWDPPPPRAVEQLFAGYRSVLPLTPAEELWLEASVLADGLGQIPSGPDPAGWAEAVERGL